jgi:alpha-beta hydrolase superfamily lysophospholipase
MKRAATTRRALTILALCALAPLSFARAAGPLRHSIEHDGVTLALWEKPAKKPRGVILLVHGRTWSSLPNFDLTVAGEDRSVMNAFVRAGFTAFALDLRGYGQSPRDASGWITPTHAVEDVQAALDWIAAHHGGQRPALLGYSRGSQVAVLLAEHNPAAMSALVLFGFPPSTHATSPTDVSEPPRKPTTKTAAAEDFITPGAQPQAVVDAYVAQATAADPVRTDWREEDQFVFDATRVTVPTLLLYGVNDPLRNSASLEFFGGLGTQDRAYVVLPKSDHAALVEDSGPAWVHAIVGFLDQPRTRPAAATSRP